MSAKTDKFIKTIAPLAVNEYLSRKKWILPSVCIAQAALESGWNLAASTLFGIKGEGFKATTTEYYNGHKVVIEDSFRTYPNVSSAVVGYYDFLANTPRYAKALNNTDYKDTVDKLIHTLDGAPYATDPDYIDKIVSIIEDYKLTEYDNRPVEEKKEDKKPATKYKEGDTVSFDKIYYTSMSNEALKPDITSGKITRVLPERKHPYLINGGTGWVDDACIVEEKKATPKKAKIEPGNKVKVLKAINYDNGEAFDLWYDTYDVLQVEGNRAVIGIGDVTTSAIDIKNIKKV